MPEKVEVFVTVDVLIIELWAVALPTNQSLDKIYKTAAVIFQHFFSYVPG